MGGQTWIFQGNPLRYNIDRYLAEEPYIYWSVYFPSHIRAISIGDDVFLWRASGKGKFISGIVGYGMVEEPCLPADKIRYPKKVRDDLWILRDKKTKRPNVGIKLSDVRLDIDSGMLPREYIKTDLILSKLEIVRFANATTFKITPERRQRILELWGAVDLAIKDEKIYETYREGGVKQVTLKQYIRSQQARTACINHYGCKCFICGLDFSEVYGTIGQGYIQVHHLNEVSSQKAEYEIDPVMDMRPLCANCHAIIHRRNPAYTVDEFRELISND